MQTTISRRARSRVRPPLGARPATSSGWSTSRSTTSTTSPSSASRRCCAGSTPPRGSSQPDEFIPILEQTGQIREVGRWVLQARLRADGRLARARRHARRLGERLRPPARRRQPRRRRPRRADEQRAAGDLADHRGDRDRADAQRRRDRPAAAVPSRTSASGSRSTTSAPATRRWPTCASSRSTASRSTGCSPTRSRPRPSRGRLIGTLVQLGKDLGLSTLAEGVETTDEMDLLRGASVDQAQGFLMARPVSPEVLETQFLAPTRATRTSRKPDEDRARRRARVTICVRG